MPNKEFPFEITEVNLDDIDEKFRPYCKDRVFVGPKKWCFPKKFVQLKDVYYNFEVRPDDVWITGYPRSGTTMTQELIWTIANDLDFETAKSIPVEDRIPYFEWGMTSIDHTSHGNGDQVQQFADNQLHNLARMDTRRFMKTHIPFSMLPQNMFTAGCKVIYVARNPKDVMTSLYNFFDLMKLDGYKLSFQEHYELFSRGLLVYCPYLEHIKQAWELRNEQNMLFVFYEDILKNKAAEMRRIAHFLGKKLTNKDIKDLTSHMDVSNFKKNKSLNNMRLRELGLTNKNREHDFIRKGIIGDWKNHADLELDEKANRWIEDNMKGTGIQYTYQ